MVTSLSLLTLECCGHLTRPKAGRKLTLDEATACWDDLAGDDFARVKRAIEQLAADASRSVPLLRQRMAPAVAADAERLTRLIEALGSDDFDMRDGAFRELTALGDQAEPALRRAFKTAGSLELRRRLERLLADIDRNASTPTWLRHVRACKSSNSSARRKRGSYCNGWPTAPRRRLTRAAQAAHDRLDRSNKSGEGRSGARSPQ